MTDMLGRAEELLAARRTPPPNTALNPPDDIQFELDVEAVRRHRAVDREARRRDTLEALGTQELTPLGLGEILDMPEQEHDWIIPDFLERRDRLILTGSEGRGKSVFLRQIAICAAAGVHPLRWRDQIEPRRVLVIDAENSLTQWARGARYLAGRTAQLGSADPRVMMTVQAGARMDLTVPDQVAKVHKMIDQFTPDILMIGPLYKLVPKEITNDDDAAPLIMALDGLRERGLTLLMEAHAGKGKVDNVRDVAPRGSSALLGWPEFGLGIRPIIGDDSMIDLVRWRGDREHRDWPERMRHGIREIGELSWMPC